MRNKYRSRRFERKSQKRIPKKTILILCEGEQTEPRYFKSIRIEKRLKM
ncbi:MAG: hypothetical protein SNJ70_07860 [Armatimonadota bacterium]